MNDNDATVDSRYTFLNSNWWKLGVNVKVARQPKSRKIPNKFNKLQAFTVFVFPTSRACAFPTSERQETPFMEGKLDPIGPSESRALWDIIVRHSATPHTSLFLYPLHSSSQPFSFGIVRRFREVGWQEDVAYKHVSHPSMSIITFSLSRVYNIIHPYGWVLFYV